MRFLWLTWKDRKHPQAGGAETVNEELAKRLVQGGHEVIILTSGFKNVPGEEVTDGYKVIRLGNKWTVYYRAYQYYKKNLQGWADVVIDEINTIPFFAKHYAYEKNILFVHQLCRKVWFYQMIFPLSVLGYFLEPIYLRLLRDRSVITVSQSTKNNLMKYGFKDENIKIISEGIDLEPLESADEIKKFEKFTILSFGSVRAMKRTDDIIKAFELAKEKIPRLSLVIAGDFGGGFGRRALKLARSSKFKKSIEFCGKVNGERKVELMQKSHLLCAASVKEGWGLVVTEANSQGTPAVVYDVDGLRDAVRNGETGLVCEKNTPESMAENIVELYSDKNKYEKLRRSALRWSREINFEKSYRDFETIVSSLCDRPFKSIKQLYYE